MQSASKHPQPPAGNPGRDLVDITINGVVYPVRPGRHPVAQLKTIPNPNIPPDEILCQMIDGELKSLGNHDHVVIHGGEVFASNCPSGGAS